MAQAASTAQTGNTTSDTPWHIRMYRDGDIPALVALRNAAYAANGEETTTSVEEMEHNYQGPFSDPPRQVIVADGPAIEGVPGGMPLGVGRIVWVDDEGAGERLYQMGLVVHPGARPLGLERVIASRLVQIAREHEQEPDTRPFGKVSLLATAGAKNVSTAETYRGLGLADVRHGWLMERSLHEPIPAPREVEGVTMRPYRLPEDNRASLEAFNNSFVDHFEFHALPLDLWEHRLTDPSFRPDLSLLAEIEAEPGKLAGFCLCSVNQPDNERKGAAEGWIDLLGTIRGWRGKGLGKSLLLHGMLNLKAAGMRTALLGVDSESPTGANRLYESVGFTVRDHQTVFKSPLADITT